MANEIPDSPDVWLGREATAAALTASGFPTTVKTLEAAATRDPTLPYRINAKRAEHQWGPTLAWRLAKVRYHGCASRTENQYAA